ncbi:MAG: hypothetical protein V3U71_07260 [Cocleimonas sp.]
MDNKSPIESLLSEYLEGLILPEKAISTPLIVWLLLATLLCILLYSLWKWLKFRKLAKQRALRDLKAIHKGLFRQETRLVAFKLAKLLRQGLNVSRLSLFHPQEVNKWEGFRKRINAACYSTEVLAESELQELIQQTEYWLIKS